jgi:hypothetical protein
MAEGVEGLVRDKSRKPGKEPLPPSTVKRVIGLVAAGDDHLGAFDGELAGDLKTDAGGRAGDEGGFVAQVQIHGGVSFYALRRWVLPEPLAVADFGLDGLAFAPSERALQHVAGDRVLAQEGDALPSVRRWLEFECSTTGDGFTPAN